MRDLRQIPSYRTLASESIFVNHKGTQNRQLDRTESFVPSRLVRWRWPGWADVSILWSLTPAFTNHLLPIRVSNQFLGMMMNHAKPSSPTGINSSV